MPRLSFNVQPSAQNTCIRSLYDMYLKDDRNLNCRPPYQRNLCWKSDQKSDLIDSMMTSCPMPNFLLYMCAGVNECIDGQNRLSTIKQYMEQGADPFPWKIETYAEDDTTLLSVENVFYKKNDEIDAYILAKAKKPRKNGVVKSYRYMDDQELMRFHVYEVILQKITSPLSLEQRKEIFTRWQSGSRITQCERFKNEPYPFCLLLLERGIEKVCGDALSEFLKSGKDNWVFDVYRMLLLFIEPTNDISFSAQNTISTLVNIKSPTGQYNISNQTYMECVAKLNTFLDKNEHLKNMPKNFRKLSFLMSFAHIWFSKKPEERKIMETEEFLTQLSEKCKDMKFNTLNNGPHSNELLKTHPAIKTYCDELISNKMPPVEKKKKATISEALKTAVWNTYYGKDVGSSECLCCGITKIFQRDFHCAHLIAESKGGPTSLENLRPTCAKCNQSCATRNLREYMAEAFPGRKI